MAALYIPYPKEYDFHKLDKLDEAEFNNVSIVKINANIYDFNDDYIYDTLLKFKNLKEILIEDKFFMVIT